MTTCSSILAWRIPVDSGAWSATAHGVTKSWTQLKRLRTYTEYVNESSVFAQIISSCIDSLSPMINPCPIVTKMDNWKRNLANKDESEAKK